MNLLNQRVKHKKQGSGIVIAQNEKSITVAFSNNTMKFIYPDPVTFLKFLQAENPSVQDAILQEIEAEKQAKEAARLAAEEAKRKAEEVRQKAEEEARAAAQARKEAEAAAKNPRKQSSKKAVAPKIERIPGKPLTFYVFQGSTFDIESRGGFIWAPKYNQRGGKVFHWDNLLLIKKGDIILHGYDAKVAAVSKAITDGYDCERPPERAFEEAWTNEGRRVDLQYLLLRNPIKTSEYTYEILEYCKAKYSPFDRDGNGNMGYLYELNRELAKVFLRAIIRYNPELRDVDYIQELLGE